MVFSCSIITALIAAGAASSALAVPINARDLDDRRFDNVGEPHWQSSHRHHEDQFGGPRHRHHELLGEDEFEFEFEEHHPHSHHQGDDEFLRITMSKEGLVLSITTTIPTTLIVMFTIIKPKLYLSRWSKRSSTMLWECRTRLGLTKPLCQ
ncbi:hypothetical protein F5051DRAFT_163431 [Lentinula edodes]|nr:hypothetical protein F5051DRAFT_163431 [Lentinula edodes]